MDKEKQFEEENTRLWTFIRQITKLPYDIDNKTAIEQELTTLLEGFHLTRITVHHKEGCVGEFNYQVFDYGILNSTDVIHIVAQIIEILIKYAVGEPNKVEESR